MAAIRKKIEMTISLAIWSREKNTREILQGREREKECVRNLLHNHANEVFIRARGLGVGVGVVWGVWWFDHLSFKQLSS